MSFGLHIRESAKTDLRHALDYYSIEAPHEVPHLLDDIDTVEKRLCRIPLTPKVRTAGVREMHLDDFPYAYWYLVHEELQLVEITSFVHDWQEDEQFYPRHNS